MNKNKREKRNLLLCDDRPLSVDIYCLVYNHGKYLRQALDGMIMQETSFPVRIIIHDDASTDDSADIIKEYQKQHPERIVAVIEDNNLYQNGQSIWKKMLPYFTAKYVAICEGDDYWTDPHKLQKQISFLESHLDYAACYHNILPVDKEGQYREELRGMYTYLEEGDYTENEIRSFVLKTQTATLVRRNFNPWLTEKDKEVYLSTRCNGDEKLLLLCSAYGKIHYLEDVMAAHRRVLNDGESWTAKQNKKNANERFIASQRGYLELCRFFEHFHGKKVYPYNYIIIERLKYYNKMRLNNTSFTEEERQAIKGIITIPFYAYAFSVPAVIWHIIKHAI